MPFVENRIYKHGVVNKQVGDDVEKGAESGFEEFLILL